MPRIMSDARPWVGGGKLYAAPWRSGSARGAFTCAQCRSRSSPRTGLPARARSAAIATRERTAVERIESVAREPAQRPSEALVHEPVACRRDRASGKELLREPRNVFELRPLAAGVGMLARGDRHAVLGVVDGVGQEPVERVRAAQRSLTASAASHPDIVPATVFAASGPRAGMASNPCDRYPLRSGSRRGPAARIDRDQAPHPAHGRSRTRRRRWRSCAGRRRRWWRRRRPSPRWRCPPRAVPRARTGPRDGAERRPCPWWRQQC